MLTNLILYINAINKIFVNNIIYDIKKVDFIIFNIKKISFIIFNIKKTTL